MQTCEYLYGCGLTPHPTHLVVLCSFPVRKLKYHMVKQGKLHMLVSYKSSGKEAPTY